MVSLVYRENTRWRQHSLITGNRKFSGLSMFMFIELGKEKFLSLLRSRIKTNPAFVVR